MLRSTFFRTLTSACVLLMIGAFPQASAQATCGTSVTVTVGDTLGKIAARCNTTLDAILRANPDIENPNLIFVGQTITMPGGQARPDPVEEDPDPPTGDTYTIRRGDTLGKVAARFGVALNALLAANPQIENPNLIEIGWGLVIPGRGEPSPPSEPDPDTQVTISPTSGPPGTEVRMRGENFPPRGTLQIGGGLVASEYEILDRVRTDGTGSFSMTLRVPASTEPGQRWVFVVTREGVRWDVNSNVFSVTEPTQGPPRRIEQPVEPVEVRGELTGEGVECQALRAENGTLYTLTGDLRGYEAGTRVYVRGRVADISHCQQGTTLNLMEIRRVEDISGSGEPLLIEGELTDEGVECPALRTDDGDLYTLAGLERARYEVGDRLQIKGTVAEISTCMQGTTLNVQSVQQVNGGDRNPPEVVRIEGRLTDEGVECQALRTDDGDLYTLTGELHNFQPGDRVYVEGTVATLSTCQQGTTINVRRIERR